MTKRTGIPGTAEAWESGALGKSEAHVKRATEIMEQQIEDALGMQAISIRMPRSTIETYKLLAKMHGVGYQPLMRDAMCRWAEGEMKQLLIGAVENQRQEEAKRPDADQAPQPKMRKAA